MFECLILGDSTALGAGRAINATHIVRCDVLAVEGASAAQILTWPRAPKRYSTIIVAVGSNDAPTPPLRRALVRIRVGLAARRVIWLLPYARSNAAIVNSIAISFADESLDLAQFPSRDRVHPSRYEDLVKVLLK
ncbi:hypothetical protein E5A73_20060 [Sphingomonas gei]|uniref:SGNH hydrolase-type esterase domain-containing protein n=2 Tax=Sphingomonas gei TaxID=1395960 RepID=A0A4S1X006_9SPHN|nr:hypothetical protein E5A73_20060 [Sphingomonas gei]